MDVVCASDSDFVPHLATMLLSLVENNGDKEIRIFVLTNGALPGEHMILEMLRGYSASISFSSVSDYLYGNLEIKRSHFTKHAYARLLMDKVLPPDVERAIYLDCDLIVRGSLGSLWKYDLCGRTAGAVLDPIPYAHHSLLGLPLAAPYFNSGVMLIDLKRWRDRDIGGRAMKFARSHPQRLQWADQCALNLMLHDDWVPLDMRWNLQTSHIGVDRHGFVHFKRLPAAIRESTKVVHYSGWSKPWRYFDDHPMKRDYLEYRRRTPWPLDQFEDRTTRNVVRRFVHKRLPLVAGAYYRADSIIRKR